MQKLLCALLAGLVIFPAHASESIHTEDVVVTASRVTQSRENVLADVTIIDRAEIERAGQSTLVELLQRQPGIEISSNGGAGKATSVYLRGTNADHVVVLVDGIRLNSATLGTTSFENLPLGQIERIEILRGPASSLYGADAIGGVIQIFTRRGQDAPQFSAFAGYGKNDTQRVEAGVSGGANEDATRYSLHVSGVKTDGFSAKKVSTGYDADDDGYENLAFSTALSQQLAEGHVLEAQFLRSYGRNEYDCNKRECYQNQVLREYALTSRNRFLPFWQSTLKWGVGMDDSRDVSRNTATTRPSLFRTDQYQLTWQNDFSLPMGTLTLAYDRLRQKVGGTTNYAEKSRDNDGWLASYMLDYGVHSFQASVRRDDNSQFGWHTTGNVAYGIQFAEHWRLSAGYGTAFKAPTFNQLYFPGFGDPDLRPEQSRSKEAALRYDDGQLRASVTFFRNDIRDLIAFSGPATAGCSFAGFCPENVGKARITGATLEGGWQFAPSWRLSGHYTVQSPRNEDTDHLLARRGQRHGALDLTFDQGPYYATLEIVGASKRYNDADQRFVLDGYAVVNVAASYAFHRDWRLEARADNIFDKEYVLASTKSAFSPAGPDYQTPGANVFIGLRWQPK